MVYAHHVPACINGGGRDNTHMSRCVLAALVLQMQWSSLRWRIRKWAWLWAEQHWCVSITNHKYVTISKYHRLPWLCWCTTSFRFDCLSTLFGFTHALHPSFTQSENLRSMTSGCSCTVFLCAVSTATKQPMLNSNSSAPSGIYQTLLMPSFA